MTTEQLDEIEKLAEAATPGPWDADVGVDFDDGCPIIEWYACGPSQESREFDEDGLPSLGAAKGLAAKDAAFIAAMREHALPLVKALREARLERDEAFRERADWLHSLDRSKADIAMLMRERDEARVMIGTQEQEILSRCAEAQAAIAERDEARAEVERLKERLQVDTGGSDQIDALEDALTQVRWERDEVRAELKERQETLEQAVAERASALAERNWANERYHEAQAENERLKKAETTLCQIIAALRANLDSMEAERDRFFEERGNALDFLQVFLDRAFGDGVQYQDEHGLDQAVKEADELFAAALSDRTASGAARAEVERLREAARQVHALASVLVIDWDPRRVNQAVYEIHKITKGMVE